MAFDSGAYARLLADIQPAIIETPEQHEHFLTIAEQFMEKEQLSEEEEKLLALLVLLIEAYQTDAADDEDEGPVEPPSPHLTLRRLMEARGLGLEDVADLFGNPHAAREAVEGRRPISSGQAKQLANYFQVPAKLFRS